MKSFVRDNEVESVNSVTSVNLLNDTNKSSYRFNLGPKFIKNDLQRKQPDLISIKKPQNKPEVDMKNLEFSEIKQGLMRINTTKPLIEKQSEKNFIKLIGEVIINSKQNKKTQNSDRNMFHVNKRR